jgi:hypothetical protein
MTSVFPASLRRSREGGNPGAVHLGIPRTWAPASAGATER